MPHKIEYQSLGQNAEKVFDPSNDCERMRWRLLPNAPPTPAAWELAAPKGTAQAAESNKFLHPFEFTVNPLPEEQERRREARSGSTLSPRAKYGGHRDKYVDAAVRQIQEIYVQN